jgi:hypothetical protein
MSEYSEQFESSTLNAKVITDLNRRRLRAKRWFLVFVALIPTGCVAIFVALIFFPGITQSPAVIGVVLSPFVGLGGTLLMLGDRSRYKRAIASAEQGSRMGLTFIEKPKKTEYAWMRSLKCFRKPDAPVAVWNVLVGQAGGLPLSILDSGYVLGLDRNKQVFQQTVYLLGNLAGVPDFVLYPRTWLDKIGAVLSDCCVELPGNAAFNKQFALRGDQSSVSRCYGPDLIDLCLAEKDITVEAHEGRLLACRMGQLADVAVHPQMVSWISRAAAMLTRNQ